MLLILCYVYVSECNVEVHMFLVMLLVFVLVLFASNPSFLEEVMVYSCSMLIKKLI